MNSDIVEEAHLIKVESRANSNKFYRLTLSSDGQVTKRWGRVGAKGQMTVESGGRANFDRTLQAKTRRGYSPVEVLATDVVTAGGGDAELKAAARHIAADDDPVLTDLIDRLVATNKHNLLEASGGLITVDVAGQVTTPLGIIGPGAIALARTLLDRMTKLQAGAALGDLTDQYLRLVPQKVKASLGAGWADSWLYDLTSPTKQYDLLDALTASVAHAETLRKRADEAAANAGDVPDDLFRYRVKLLDPTSEEHAAVVARYADTKQDVRSWAKNLRVKHVFELEDVRLAGEVAATAAGLSE